MKQVCAWCGKDMGDSGQEGEGITHDVCEECAEKELEEAKKLKTEREKERKNPEMKIR